MKLAIFFPGIGYTNDKPLMYYSRKLLQELGYEELCVEYHDLPGKVRGDKRMLLQAANMAYEQAKEKLAACDFTKYEQIVLVGKSIGTYLAVKIAKGIAGGAYDEKSSGGAFVPEIKLVLYTPVEETFLFGTADGTASGELADVSTETAFCTAAAGDVFSDAIAFIGDNDPWSKLDEVKRLASMRNVPLHLYHDCNHSLETGDCLANIEILGMVMRLTKEYLNK